jgi:hypothetical protein
MYWLRASMIHGHSYFAFRVYKTGLPSTWKRSGVQGDVGPDCVWRLCGLRLCRVIVHLFRFFVFLALLMTNRTILLWGYANHIFERHKEARLDIFHMLSKAPWTTYKLFWKKKSILYFVNTLITFLCRNKYISVKHVVCLYNMQYSMRFL